MRALPLLAACVDLGPCVALPTRLNHGAMACTKAQQETARIFLIERVGRCCGVSCGRMPDIQDAASDCQVVCCGQKITKHTWRPIVEPSG